jgi:hypothetical protein
MSIRRRHLVLSQARQCGPEVIHTRNCREWVIHPGGKRPYRDLNQLVDRKLGVLAGGFAGYPV